jgi:hypothetical protein
VRKQTDFAKSLDAMSRAIAAAVQRLLAADWVVSDELGQEERLCGGAGNHLPSLVVPMAAGNVTVAPEARIWLGMVDYRTGVADWRGDRLERPRTPDLIGQHLIQNPI